MDINALIESLLLPTGQIALIIGLAELFKRVGINSKYIPLIDVGLGIISGIVVYGISMNYGILKGVMVGIFIGLSACGLFSGVKNLISNNDNQTS